LRWCTPVSARHFPGWNRAIPTAFPRITARSTRAGHQRMHARQALFVRRRSAGSRPPHHRSNGSDTAMFDNTSSCSCRRAATGPCDDDDVRNPGRTTETWTMTGGVLPVSFLPDGTVGRDRLAICDHGWQADRRGCSTAIACVSSRYYVTKDGLVIMASEAGVLDIPPERVLQEGPPAAGPHVPGRHRGGPHHRRCRDHRPRFVWPNALSPYG